jgi:hypothetical protein
MLQNKSSLVILTLFLTLALVSGFYKAPLSKRSLSIYASTEISETSLTSDGGVKKKLLQSGTGNSVSAGDILAIEYTASIAGGGITFAKADKEKFVYADGSLIKGWDTALGSMKVGESAKFTISSLYGYGTKGVIPVIPPNADLEIEVKILAWLGNQMRPESLFQKDLDIDPFVASSPEAIQQEYDEMRTAADDKYEGNILEIYIRRIKNISFGFGGSGFFQSQSGERPPWYLNPNLTFPGMIVFSISLFAIVFNFGGVKEKGESKIDLEISSITQMDNRENLFS